MEKGIRIKYIAAAMSEILGMDVPCDEICIIPNEITKVRGIGFESNSGCYLYLNHVLSPEIVEKLAEEIKDNDISNSLIKDNPIWVNCQNIIDEYESVFNKSEEFKSITSQMHDTYIKKNHDYGNSFGKSMDEFGIASAIIRMNDKLERLKTLSKKESMVKDESVKDTLLDLANYAIMTVMYLKKHEDKDGTDNE